jgi:saccharopine dehydrogenase-like NADP-dependent oxidoreductase
VLALCLKVKTDIEVNKELRRMVKRIAELEILKKSKEEHIAKLKSLKDVPFFSKEDIEKQEQELAELEKELEDLKKKVEENK